MNSVQEVAFGGPCHGRNQISLKIATSILQATVSLLPPAAPYPMIHAPDASDSRRIGDNVPSDGDFHQAIHEILHKQVNDIHVPLAEGAPSMHISRPHS